MASTEDISAFLSTDEFAVTATIGAASVSVIFDNGFQTALGGAMDSSGPTAVGATADLAAAIKGTALAIGGVNYLVVSNKPDGTGITMLILERAAA